MQPPSPVPLLLAFQAPSDNAANPEGATTASVLRVEERPVSALAQGSYAWPAWAVIAVASVSALGALTWWLRLRGRKGAPPASLTTARSSSTRVGS